MGKIFQRPVLPDVSAVYIKAQLEAIVMKLVEAEEAAESPETCDADLFAESRNHIGIQVSESSSSDIESHSGTKC